MIPLPSTSTTPPSLARHLFWRPSQTPHHLSPIDRSGVSAPPPTSIPSVLSTPHHHTAAMSASPEVRRSPAALDQLFPRSPTPRPPFDSPARQLHLQLLPAEIFPSQGSQLVAAAPDQPAAGGTEGHIRDDFTTPTGDAHRIPVAGASDACPPAPKKPRPSTTAAPACRRRLIEGELLRVPPEEVERLFGRTWTRTTPTPPPPAAGSGPAVLPAKKRKRCYAEAAA